MKQCKIILLLLLCIHSLHAQNQAKNWYFGDNAGITFSTSPPSFLPGGAISQFEGCATISDNAGNLLFYSDGMEVYCSNHTVMPNSTGLYGNASSTQSCIIVPLPGSTSLYYIITAPEYTSSYPLAYSIVDMTLNGGLGAVTVKNVTLLFNSTEKVTAVHHQNGNDIWIIAHEFPGNDFHAFLLTASGINLTPVISSAGNPITVQYYKIGYLKASPCGNQLAAAACNFNAPSFLELFDFDNLSGTVSNAIVLGTWNILGDGIYGVEFSPDNSRLYATIIATHEIVQYNLLAGSAAAIIASQVTIGTTGFNLGALQTGPDGKIYVSKTSSDSLGCIDTPNQLGLASNYIDGYISIAPSTCTYGLPGFLTSYFCNIPSGVNEVNEENDVLIYPNPFGDAATLQISNDLLNKKCELNVYDLLGHRVKQLPIINQHTSLNKENLTSGIYFYVLTAGDELVKKGKIIIE